MEIYVLFANGHQAQGMRRHMALWSLAARLIPTSQFKTGDPRLPTIKIRLFRQYGQEAYSEEEKHVGSHAPKIIINRLSTETSNGCSTGSGDEGHFTP